MHYVLAYSTVLLNKANAWQWRLICISKAEFPSTRWVLKYYYTVACI